MLTEAIKTIFNRDLNALKKEIASYKNEAVIWHTERNISNSAGNLCLHLIGNVNHFFGATLGNTGYVRNRDAEFNDKNITAAYLISQIDAAIKMMDDVLFSIRPEQLQQEYPLMLMDKKHSVEFVLIFMTTHFSYHLGQINYHRRLLDI